MRRVLVLILILMLVGCNGQKDEPLPTQVNPQVVETQLALNATATANQIATLASHTPSATFTPSDTPTATNTRTPTYTRTPTPSDTPLPSPTHTASFTPLPSLTPTDTPTATFTPSATPTRALNPDAVVGVSGADLLIEPEVGATAVTRLQSGAAVEVDFRTPDSQFFQIRLLNGQGNGWVRAADLILFIPLESIPIQGEAGELVTATLPPPPPSDLTEPQFVGEPEMGTGQLYLPYEYALCGDTYWTGDGLSYSMENFAVNGRYPRFKNQPIRVYVHGLSVNGDPEWELAISQTFALLSQAVRFERVEARDLEFFQPWVTMQTLLADNRLDMVWHIAAPTDFEQQAPCDNPNSCSEWRFSGLVMGGPLRFGGLIYLPSDTDRKVPALLHAAMHALGLWVHSPISEDLMAEIYTADQLSARDVATLRCLYNAPPYGD